MRARMCFIYKYDGNSYCKRSGKAPLMSTHNICFHGELRQVSIDLYWKENARLDL